MIDRLRHIYYYILSKRYRLIYKYCEFQKTDVRDTTNLILSGWITCVSTNDNLYFRHYDSLGSISILNKSNGKILGMKSHIDDRSMCDFIINYKGVTSPAIKRKEKLLKIK